MMTGADLAGALHRACLDSRLSTLTGRQIAMLVECDRQDWLMHALAQRMRVSVTVISRGADALIADRLMERVRQAGNKRKVWLRITKEGRSAVETMIFGGE